MGTQPGQAGGADTPSEMGMDHLGIVKESGQHQFHISYIKQWDLVVI